MGKKKSLKQRRAERDEVAAKGALHMAADHGGKPAVGVDDWSKVGPMVERVERLATEQELSFVTHKTKTGVYIRFTGAGQVYVFPADQLVPPKHRPN